MSEKVDLLERLRALSKPRTYTDIWLTGEEFKMLADALSAVPEGRVQEAWDKAIELAAVHVDLQHVVWDETDIPPQAMLDLIAKNIRAFKGKPHLASLPQEGSRNK